MKTYEEVRAILGVFEPSDSTYAALGPEDLPQVARLVDDPEPWRAARAVFAASRIGSEPAHALLLRAAQDARPEVRVAAVSSAPRTPAAVANAILERLIDDRNVGVSKFAIRAVGAQASPVLRSKLQTLGTQAPDSSIQALARERLRHLP